MHAHYHTLVKTGARHNSHYDLVGDAMAGSNQSQVLDCQPLGSTCDLARDWTIQDNACMMQGPDNARW
jgi:hypothetical protein